MEDSFKINKYYRRGFEEGKKVGEQEGLDKVWAAAEEKICQLVDEKDMLKKEIERLNKLNQNMIENYRYFYSTPAAFPSIWEGRFPFWEGRFL